VTTGRVFECDVLVLAAFAPELDAFRAALGDDDHGVFVYGPRNVRVSVASVGIGLPAAAVGASRVLATRRARAAILIGTCGAYDFFSGASDSRGLGLADVATATTVVLADSGVADGRSAYPGAMARPIATDAKLAAGLIAAGGTSSRVATTLAVTTDDHLAACLARSFRATAEHLEAYAVALACHDTETPFATALGVANRVGETGRAEWRANHGDAGARAARLVVGWIEKGADGLGLHE
jgi:nucleoside phosphorylase